MSKKEKEIEELKKKIEMLERKTGKLTKGVKNFMDAQEEIGEAVIPLQRIGGYLGVFIFFVIGLGLIIYASVTSDEMVKTPLYAFGAIVIFFAAIMLVVVYYYTKYIGQTRAGRVFNAFNFELGMVDNLINNK